jgi:hypothetical protein
MYHHIRLHLLVTVIDVSCVDPLYILQQYFVCLVGFSRKNGMFLGRDCISRKQICEKTQVSGVWTQCCEQTKMSGIYRLSIDNRLERIVCRPSTCIVNRSRQEICGLNIVIRLCMVSDMWTQYCK